MPISAATHPAATAEQLYQQMAPALTDFRRSGVAAAARPAMLGPLAARILEHPGGRWVGDRWLDEPLELVALRHDQAYIDLACVLGAYADRTSGDRSPRPLADDDVDGMLAHNWAGQWIVAVPATVAELALWHLGSAPVAEYLRQSWPAGAPSDPAARQAVAHTAVRLWRLDGLDDLHLDEVGSLVDVACELVTAHGPGGPLERLLATAEAVDGTLLADAHDTGELAATLQALAGP